MATPAASEMANAALKEPSKKQHRLADQFGRLTEIYKGGVFFVLGCWIATALIYIGCLDLYPSRNSQRFLVLTACYSIGVATLGTFVGMQLALVFSRLRALMLHTGAKPNQVPGNGVTDGLIFTVILAVRGRMSLGKVNSVSKLVTFAGVVWFIMCYLMSWCVLLVGPNVSENGYRTRVEANIKVVKNVSAFLSGISKNLTKNIAEAGTGAFLRNQSFISWEISESMDEKNLEFGTLNFPSTGTEKTFGLWRLPHIPVPSLSKASSKKVEGDLIRDYHKDRLLRIGVNCVYNMTHKRVLGQRGARAFFPMVFNKYNVTTRENSPNEYACSAAYAYGSNDEALRQGKISKDFGPNGPYSPGAGRFMLYLATRNHKNTQCITTHYVCRVNARRITSPESIRAFGSNIRITEDAISYDPNGGILGQDKELDAIQTSLANFLESALTYDQYLDDVMYPYPTTVRNTIMQQSFSLHDTSLADNGDYSLQGSAVAASVYQILSKVLIFSSFPYIEKGENWLQVYVNWTINRVTDPSIQFPDFKSIFSLKDSDFVEVPDIIKEESGLPGNLATEYMALTLLIMWSIALFIEAVDLLFLDPVTSFIRFRVRSFAGTVKLCAPLELTGGSSASIVEEFPKPLKIVVKDSTLRLSDKGKEIDAGIYYN